MRDLKIKKVLNGFRVRIGCQEVVFTSKKKLIKELSRYIDDPNGVTKEYLEKYKKNQTNPSDIVVEMSNGAHYGNVGFVCGDMHIGESEQVVIDDIITGSVKKSGPIRGMYADNKQNEAE